MKEEEIKKFVDKMSGDDFDMFLKIYTKECWKERVEMGFESSYEEFLEDWCECIDDHF